MIKQLLIILSLVFWGTNTLHANETSFDLQHCKTDTCLINEYIDLAHCYMVQENKDSVDYYFYKVRETADCFLNKSSNADTLSYIVASKAFYSIGKYYLNTREEYAKAIDFYLPLIKICKRLSWDKKAVKAYRLAANAYEFQSDYQNAIDFRRKSMDLCKQMGDSINYAYGFIGVANVYKNWGQPYLALENYKKCYNICLRLNDNAGISYASIGIGNIYGDFNKPEESIKYYQKSLDLEKLDSNNEGILLNLANIGGAYNKIGDFDLALEYSLEALEYSVLIDNKLRRALILDQIGKTYLLKKNYQKALEFLMPSYELAKEINFKKVEQNSLNNLANTYSSLGDYQNAFTYLQEYNSVKDSIFNEQKFKELSTLETKYKTAEKNKTIQLQKKEIEANNLKLKQERIIRYIIFGSLILALLLSLYVYKNYRQKMRANIQLALNRDKIQKQRDDIQEQKIIIERIHHEVSESINYATRLQQSVLPNKNELNTVFFNHFILFKPRDKVSGDFYWWWHNEDCTIITAADSTGHGVPGAFMSLLGITFLREIVMKESIYQADQILNQLRYRIIKALNQTGKAREQKDGMDISLVTFNHKNNTALYAGAFNPLYIIRQDKTDLIVNNDSIKASQTQNDSCLYEIKADKMPIAIYEKMHEFGKQKINLNKGDRLYMFSDGFSDQFGGQKGKKYKSRPFKKLLLRTCHLPMEEQKIALEKSFIEWQGDLNQVDDVIILGVEI